MSITLQYLKGRGFMRVTKLILATAGKLPGEYFDERCVEAPKFGLEPNLGRLPIAKIGDKTIGQSAAINFYFASEYGLMGRDNYEAAQIVSISEHLREMADAYRSLVPAGSQPTRQALDAWFEGGAQDVRGHAVQEDRDRRYLTWWMGRIEQVVGAKGYAVGGALSLADILLYNAFAETETLRDEYLPEGAGLWRKGPMGDQARLEAMLARHPRVKACCGTVSGNANVQRWLAVKET